MARSLLLVLSAGLALTAPALAQPTTSAKSEAPAQVAAPVRAAAVQPARPTIAQFMKIRTPGSPALLPDGTLLTRDWPEGVNQLYRTAALPKGAHPATAGAPRPQALTAYKDGLSGFSLSPNGSMIILSFAAGGNENTQLVLADPTAQPGPDGTLPGTPIVSNPKVQASITHWFDDSTGFIYSANDESPSDFFLYRVDVAAGKASAPQKILGKPGSWSAGDASRDKSRVLVAEFKSASDSTVHELNVATGALTELTIKGDQATASVDIVGYAPDEKSVLLLSDFDGGLKRLYRRDLASGRIDQPLPGLAKYEIDAAFFNDTKTMLAVVTNEDGYGVPHIYRLPGLEPVEMPKELQTLGAGIFGPSQFRGNTMVWSMSNARTPGLAYATTWTADGKVESTRQLTWADDQGVDLSAFPLPMLIKYSSFDGLEIPAFLYLPPGAKAGAPMAFVVNYHGGPEGQFRPGFDRTTQYLLSRGFGVLQPNIRGSSGYGRAFQMMDDYKNREASVKDGLEAARWLVREGYSTPGHIATYGGSYGGYMVNATAVADGASDKPVLGAAVTVVGIVNLQTFLEQTSGYRRKLREAEYGPLSDPEFLKSASPILRADSIRVPMMIVHGLNDPRVPVGEAMQLAVMLQQRALTDPSLEPELLYFPDEGHGLAKLNNRLLFAERMARFLDEHIGMQSK